MSRAHPLTSFNTRLADLAVAEQLIQPLKVFNVRSEVVQEHNIKNKSHDLCEGGIFPIRSLHLMFETFAADTDRENPFCPEAYDRTKRLLEARTTVTEKSRSSCYFEP